MDTYINISVGEFRGLTSAPTFRRTRWMAVISRTTRLAESIEYTVDIEGDHGDRIMTVYRRCILFGQEDANRAGGFFFVQTARDQEKVAAEFATFIAERKEGR